MRLGTTSILLPLAALAVIGCSGADKGAAASSNSNKGLGASRISIKHANDPDAASINKTPKTLTVEELIAMRLPDDVKGNLEEYTNRRIGEFEKSTYKLEGTIKSIVHKKDGDYYITFAGKSGAEAVIEVPDPKLCEGSPILNEITKTRDELERRYHPTDEAKKLNEPGSIEGVGFYGWKGRPGSGGTGRAPRLMPGTGFKGK